MITLSVCMIVKNEEKSLARCLNCVRKFADQIVVVDTGSTDKTIEIARKFTDIVPTYLWCDNFSHARNFSFSFATCDYIMWLDADDFIDDENCKKIIEFKKTADSGPPPDCVMAKYIVRPAPNEFYYYRERILRRVCGFVWTEPVHEVIIPRGRVIYIDLEILHKKLRPTPSNRNLNIYKNLIKSGKELTPRAKYYYARELLYHKKIHKAIRVFDEFLRENGGWVENKVDACILRHNAYLALNERDKAREALLQSFIYSAPRPKVVCLLAELLIRERNFTTATDWLELALTLPHTQNGWIEPDFYQYRPYVDLSVCYFYLNNIALAKKYHNMAKVIHPDTPEILFNSQFFE